MNHSFSKEVAVKYGVDEAILLENLNFWLSKNEANEKHFYDGEYWTYNSSKAFIGLFPYWSKNQIERIIKSLKEKELIITGNYNATPYDRTRWFAFTRKAKSLYGNAEMEIVEIANEDMETKTPIPDINTDVKIDINFYTSVIDYLNEKAGTKFRANTTNTKKHIKARIEEGFSFEEFKTVIDIKVAEWKDDVKYSKYLRPETLFSPKFESYLNQKHITKTEVKPVSIPAYHNASDGVCACCKGKGVVKANNEWVKCAICGGTGK